MAIRKCLFYERCKNTLFDLVPFPIVLCGECQRRKRELISQLQTQKKWPIPDKAVMFILEHENGCNARELGETIGLPNGMSKAIRSGRIRAKREKDNRGYPWTIDRNEIVRVIGLRFLWVTVHSVAKDHTINPQTAKGHAEQGLYGPSVVSYTGDRVMRIEMVPFFMEMFEEAMKKNLCHPVKHYVKDGEFTPEWLAEKLGVSINTVYYWTRKQWLEYNRRCKNGTRYTLALQGLTVFLNAILTDAYKIRVPKPKVEELLETIRIQTRCK
ncbi:MAG: hypothetical protein NT135_01310 [Candidatus Berkelbacteria bacterium]|nr:hypothetical protein [Candidatus Berkelbacteria bacterium]